MITDFSTIDRIVVENAVFIGLAAGTLAASAFKVLRPGAVFDSNDQVTYEQATGRLLYDPDGSGAAGRGVIAVLANRLTLTADDVWII
jgi:Ca2+-binding RTX toxin-like protein